MAVRLAVANEKGGVGKTAISLGLAAAWSEAGRRVLLVDLDPNGDLTRRVGLEPAGEATLAAAMLLEGGELTVVDRGRDGATLDVVPSSLDAIDLEGRLLAERGRELRLDRVLRDLDAEYDRIVIDCPAKLTVAADNAFVAARRVVAPVQPNVDAVRGVRTVLGTARAIERGLGVGVEVLGVVLNEWDDTREAAAASADLEELGVRRLGILRRRVRIAESGRLQQTIFELDPRGEVAEWFRSLAQAVDQRLGASDG